MAQMAKNLPAMQETGFDPCIEKTPWRRAWKPTPVFLPGESLGQRSLVGYSSWGCKESDTTKAQTHAYCVSSLLCAGFCEQRLLSLWCAGFSLLLLL